MVDENAAPRRNPTIEEAPLQSELMLFDPASRRFFMLNPTMAFLWKRCDGERRLADIAEELVVAFEGVGPEQAHADMVKAFDELRAFGLVA